MSKKTLTAILLGAGQRGNAYCEYALKNPDILKIVGVAEPDAVRREDFSSRHNIAEGDCVATWEDVFLRDKWADVMIICTQDTMHYGPAMAAIEKGYDILLEKPISPSPKECMEIADAAAAKKVKVVVCHVLRYTPLFAKIKEIIDSGEIGEVVTVVHNENVGDMHHSHSFVRGNWGNTAKSSPMILAKSCHDTDIIQWLVDKKCKRLSSFGSLKYFKKTNAPKGSPERCSDGCTANCPYDARELYLKSDNLWFRSVAAGYFDPTDEDVEKALKTGQYGRCVFKCDNDVVDHQVVSFDFEDDVTVTFSMSSFTPDISRSIKVMGTKGQIKAHSLKESIIITSFEKKSDREELVGLGEGGHGGGDHGIMIALCDLITGKNPNNKAISEIDISAQNHMLCFAAEKSRLNAGAVVEMEDFVKQI